MNTSNRSGRSTLFFRRSCLSALVALALVSGVDAQQRAEVASYAVAAGDLAQVVNEISRSSGVQIVYDIEQLRGLKSGEVRGAMTLAQALDRALEGSGLSWALVNPTTIAIQKKKPGSQQGSGEAKAGASATGVAPTSDKGREIEELDKLVVVGSRLGTSPLDSAMPIKVITRDEIDRSGAGSIAQMLTYLPQVPISNDADRMVSGLAGIAPSTGGNVNATSVQMRGLPRGTTLVLINGRRAGDSAAFSSDGFFDLSTIPLSLVERIEVLPAGGSAVYGGDALSGVINIVLRRDASGLELRVRRAASDGYGASQASAIWGKSWERGNLTVAGNWNKSDALFSDERSFTADVDFRRFGGSDLRTASGNPGTVYSLCHEPGYCSVPVDERDNLPGLGSPVAGIPEGGNGVGLTPGDFLATEGNENKYSRRRNLRSAEESHGVTINGNLALSPTLEVFTELTYTDRKVPAWEAQFTLDFGQYGFDTATLPADHPFNPFGVPVGVNFLYKDTGIFATYRQQHYRGLLGLRGKLGRFEWELSGSQTRDKSRAGGGTYFDTVAIAAALASKDPEATINPFVTDGSAPASQGVLESLLQPLVNNNMGMRNTGTTGFIRGTLAQLPTGDMTALLGFEVQTNRIDIDTNDTGSFNPQVHGSSTDRGIFGEVRVPLVSARPGDSWERVVATGALRRETSDRFSETALTKTLGLEVRPWQSLLLRSTYSTAFRPPFAYRDAEAPYILDTWVMDPEFGGEWFPVQAVLTGVHPDLTPETSTTITMGAVFRPSSDWSASVTHWSTKFVDQATFLAPDAIVENEALFPGRVQRNPDSGLIELVDSRRINISLQEAAGIDLDLDGILRTRAGDFYPAIAATYTYRFEQQLKDDAPVVSSLAKYNASGWAPRWKIVPRLGWDLGDWARTMLVGRYVSKYKDSVALSSGPEAGSVNTLGDFWTIDLNVDLSLARIFKSRPLLSGTHLNVGVNNLTNRLPDYCAGCSISGYDSSQYDIMGRTIYAEVRASF